jgi:subtilase family serine protease
VQLAVPNGLSGNIYVVVTTGGPFEFIYTTNDTTVSGAVPVTQLATPDLVVSSVQAPTSAQEGTPIDVSWTVGNQGLGTADGSWVDRVYLQEAGNPNAPVVELGQFTTNGPLPAGQTYSRTYQVNLPGHINDVYTVYVTTNYTGTVYEGPAGSTPTQNNTAAAANTLSVSAMPRPDLQVANIQIPSHVPAGAALSVTFDVLNQGSVATTVPHWVDRVYLSLDTTIDPGSLLIGEVGNQSALGPNQEYESTAGPVVVLERFRGDVYVIVDVDYNHQVDQWPNGKLNLVYKAIHVDPLPLPDLVTSDVIAPTQVTAGSTVAVTYTVTNLGAGATLVNSWTDTIWLTRTKGRPNPNQGDILLTSFTHNGSLDVKAGYDQTVNVTIPDQLDSGNYYITPWVDPYGVVLQDELAVNVNPDDPNQINNDNYKNQLILVLGALPDLAVTAVQGPAQIQGGNPVTISWTVQNQGIADAVQGGWGDRVYLSDNPNPKVQGAKTFYLGQVKHTLPLAKGDSYNASLTVTLSPSAHGLYWAVIANDSVSAAPLPSIPGLFTPPPPDPSTQFTPLKEVDTGNDTNNLRTQPTVVTPVPADLKITNVSIPAVNYSGESMTFSYTVTNVGSNPVWSGTQSWTDFLWLTADTTFIRDRASYLGAVSKARPGPLNPGDSYTITTTVTLPQGAGETGSQYYLWIDLDAHNDLSPLYFPYQARLEMTTWWPGAPSSGDATVDLLTHAPVDAGDNSDLLSFFTHWAYEDPTNNRLSTPFAITFREADLTITNLQVPAGAASGQTIPVTFTVTNVGARDTRVSSWTDRIFLADDASLDPGDTELLAIGHGGILKAGDSYTVTAMVPLPDSINGDFHLIVYTDAAAYKDPAGHPSDIGFNRIGIVFQLGSPLAPWDLVSFATRDLARGSVAEFQGEGNNLAIVDLPVVLTPPPDLTVSQVIVPAHATVGQQIDVNYTVTNAGGDTVPGQEEWPDMIFLARDQHLDLKADRYLGTVKHAGHLAAGQSYTIDTTVDLPTDLVGAFYLIVVTNPPIDNPRGKVFESNQRNNDRAASLILDYPPPSDLQVTTITAPSSATIGQPVTLTWMVTNNGPNAASGRWSDAVYFSPTTTWAVSNPFVGRVEFTGTLQPGQSYTQTLQANVPSLTPGPYYVIVRADIFSEVFEGPFRSNNTSASPGVVNLSAVPLLLGVPFPTTLDSNQERLFQVTVPAGRTLQVTATAGHASATMQLFASAGVAPTTTLFDASSGGALGARQVAVVPTTQPGTYYILLDGFTMPNPGTPVTIEADLVPLTITDVHTDTGGDTQYVTTTITGAGFDPAALVKLVRPGFAEREPVHYQVVNATKIVAEFDLSNLPHGLYDLAVINPGGDEALIPYRFLVTQTVEPEVTIGVGGPRYIFAGDTGTYSVALQNLGNVDARTPSSPSAFPRWGSTFRSIT